MDITLSFYYLINIINTSVPTWTDTAQVDIYCWVFIFDKTHKLFIFFFNVLNVNVLRSIIPRHIYDNILENF